MYTAGQPARGRRRRGPSASPASRAGYARLGGRGTTSAHGPASLNPSEVTMLRVSRILALSLAVPVCATEPRASGTLKPKGKPELPIQIQDHHVAVSILDGFARTEV